jgi:hypothetical protein
LADSLSLTLLQNRPQLTHGEIAVT